MIIPVRCFTCGEVLADKWVPYITAIQDDKNKCKKTVDSDMQQLDLQYIDVSQKEPLKSIEGNVLDELKLHKYCCRRMMLTNVHAISYIS
jgi:DNA-directed RNA polymerases I, II, and III subunit RPABC5